jgi:ABC-2 type transport system permease protein
MTTTAPPTPGALPLLYRLLLRMQLTRARLIAIGALGVVAVVVGATIGSSHVADPADAGARFISRFGLALLVPVASLVFASAALGARWKIVGAAALSSLTATWPIVAVPLALTAAITGGGADLVVGTLGAVTVSMIGYIGLFVALGLRVKRALVWGLLYIFIWEGFVATANSSAARLAVRTYGRSVLSAITDTDVGTTQISSPWRVVTPILVALVALTYATRRLRRQDIA